MDEHRPVGVKTLQLPTSYFLAKQLLILLWMKRIEYRLIKQADERRRLKPIYDLASALSVFREHRGRS
ncbi:hypothetical protein ALP35_02186 [Pseudomonas savastanoi pv. glycinea]|nr:hypothetical protein ALP35_02186 [Pseudomonas savastanoi pv. glycinea]